MYIALFQQKNKLRMSSVIEENTMFFIEKCFVEILVPLLQFLLLFLIVKLQILGRICCVSASELCILLVY